MIIKPYDLSDATPYHMGGFPPRSLDYERLAGPLEEAAAALARYDATVGSIVNSELFLAPLRHQDAISSSRMEGTISTMEELYQIEAEVADDDSQPHQRLRPDAIETLLYARTLRNAQRAIVDGMPLSEHLIRTAHQQLLSFGRGASKHPGRYKTEQNYIGDERRNKIAYVPIAPEHLPMGMAALIDFMNADQFRPLLRTGIAHVEFEALHPFADGNGRIGRMLITLMLWKYGILSQPHFFVSGYLETHKDEYIHRMRMVSAEADWTGWLVFFLTALSAQAKTNTRTAQAILDLYAQMRERFRAVLASQSHDQVLDYIFANPIFQNDRFVKRAGLAPSTARSAIRRLLDAGLLRTIRPAAGRAAALYAFDPLLDLVRI